MTVANKAFFKFGMSIPSSATFILEVSAQDSFKVSTKGSFRGKKSLKFEIFRQLLYERNGGVQPREL